jgi:hypothetical protein
MHVSPRRAIAHHPSTPGKGTGKLLRRYIYKQAYVHGGRAAAEAWAAGRRFAARTHIASGRLEWAQAHMGALHTLQLMTPGIGAYGLRPCTGDGAGPHTCKHMRPRLEEVGCGDVDEQHKTHEPLENEVCVPACCSRLKQNQNKPSQTTGHCLPGADSRGSQTLAHGEAAWRGAWRRTRPAKGTPDCIRS